MTMFGESRVEEGNWPRDMCKISNACNSAHIGTIGRLRGLDWGEA